MTEAPQPVPTDQTAKTEFVQTLLSRTDALITQPPLENPKMETPRVRSAVDFMTQTHEGQTRKDKVTPYSTHLLRVARRIASWGGSEDEIIAGLLHDSLEDQLQNHPTLPTDIPATFGDNVYHIVQGCTIPEGDKNAYIEQVKNANDSVKLVVSLDNFDNVVDLIHDIGLSNSGGRDVWERFGNPAEKVAERMITGYRRMAEAIRSQSTPLTEIHERLVQQINQLERLSRVDKSLISEIIKPELTIRRQTPTEEYDRVSFYLKRLSWYNKHGYRLVLPNNPAFQQLTQEGADLSVLDLDQTRQIFTDEVYDAKGYDERLQAVEADRHIITKAFPKFQELHQRWGFKIFPQYEIALTQYGTGGSYDEEAGKIIMLTEGKYPPRRTAIHEMVHIGIEQNIIQRYGLTHREKERLVDRFCMTQFPDLLPDYEIQQFQTRDEGAETLDTYLLVEGAIDDLPTTIERYVKDHPRETNH